MPCSPLRLLAGLALALCPELLRADIFNVAGSVYDASGASGNASSSNSFSGLRLARWGLAGDEAVHPTDLAPSAISPADGSSPATFALDAGSQFSAAIVAGDTLVAVAETRRGQFGWTGASSLLFQKRVVSAAESLAQPAPLFLTGSQQPLVPPSVGAATASSILLQWTDLADPGGLLSSWTVYRSTALPPLATGAYDAARAVATVSGTAGAVSYTDTGLDGGATYYYTLALNLAWEGPGAIGVGARPDQAFYTTFAQSMTIAASTLASPTPSPSATASATPTGTPSATATATLTVTKTATGTGTPTATPSDTSTASPSVTDTSTLTPSPSVTLTQTATATASPSATPTATRSVTHTHSPTATETATLSATPSITPTFTDSPTASPSPAFARQSLGIPVVAGPVPLRKGRPLCLFFEELPRGVKLTAWNVAGERVLSVDFGSEPRPCLDPGLAPGVYLLQLEQAGQKRWQKLAVLP